MPELHALMSQNKIPQPKQNNFTKQDQSQISSGEKQLGPWSKQDIDSARKRVRGDSQSYAETHAGQTTDRTDLLRLHTLHTLDGTNNQT